VQEIARIPKIANRKSDFLALQKSEFQKKNPAGIFGIVNGIGILPPMGVPEIGTKNQNSQPRLPAACKEDNCEDVEKSFVSQSENSSSKKIEEFREMVHHRHPFLLDNWCTMNGLTLMLEQSGNILIQEQFYNGLMHDHYVTSVMCFCLDGTIPIVFCNIPGTAHDSHVADYGDMYNKLEVVYLQDGAKCTVNSAFGNVNRDF
jgi:hypothetical protein